MSEQMTEMQIFREEAQELLSEIEETLLELEQNAGSRELIDRLFRAIHTIKGSGAMFGFDRIAAFAHHVETAIDGVRAGHISLSKPLIELVLASRDQITLMIDSIGSDDASLTAECNRIVAALADLTAGRQAGTPAVGAAGEQEELVRQKAPFAPEGPPQLYRIRFTPEHGIFGRHFDPLTVLRDLAALGEMRVTALIDDLPELEQLDPERCYLAYDILLTTGCGDDAIKDAFIFLGAESGVDIRKISSDYERAEEEAPKLGEILVDRGDVLPAKVEEILRAKSRLGEDLVAAGVIGPTKVESALQEQKAIKDRKQCHQASTIRVASDKLDFLINVVGELVTAQARLEDCSAEFSNLDLVSAVEEVGRLVTELRDNVMSIRMLPIGVTFEKFRRLVRDLSHQTGKGVDLAIGGGETELDKSMLEKLNDPLVHLIRNAIDHGIEEPEERERAGKPSMGRVTLRAAHIGGHVHITIEDDGAGIDADAVVRKAVAQGLLREGEAEFLSEEEKLAYILHPGLSTAKKVTNVSGRGVGMDVVKTEITKLRGRLEVDTERGKGTTITIKLPLTMAIIDGLLVRAKDTKYIIPVNCIKECIELTNQDISHAHGRHIIKVRDEVIPYIRIRELFDGAERDHEIEQLIIVEHERSSMGIVIDQIYGDHQTVIKSLGKAFTEAQGVSGATILGDGSVALIMDVPQLINFALTEECKSLARQTGEQVHVH